MKSIIFPLIFVVTTSSAQLAQDKCKFLGNIISNYTPTDFTTNWNQVTPENGGKWGSVEATKDNMVWTDLDHAYKTARDNGLPFKQHAFVWGQQQPSWIGSLSPEEQEAQVDQWIKDFCERYPDTDYIDVVNEPLHAVPVYSNALGGSGTTGWDWVIWAFEKARNYCPKAKLILNEYNVINNNSATNQYLAIINLLKSRQLIDYIGEQGHFLETTPNSTITANLDKLAATGLPILISEYDVNLSNDNEQKAKYESQFPLIWGHNGVHGVTLWGYRQGEIWRTDSYLVRTNGTPRPAFDWLKSFVKNHQGGTFCIVTEVEEDHGGFAVYPNPSGGEVEIDSENGFVVRDLNGNMLARGAGSASLHLSPGFYIVQSSGESKKLVVR